MAHRNQTHNRERGRREEDDQALESADDLLHMLASCAVKIESCEGNRRHQAGPDNVAGHGRIHHAPPQQHLAGTQARPSSDHGRQLADKEEASAAEHASKHEKRKRAPRRSAGSKNWKVAYLQLIQLPMVADVVTQLDASKLSRKVPATTGVLNQMLGAIITAAANPAMIRFPGSQLPAIEPFANLMRSTAALTIPSTHRPQAVVNPNAAIQEVVSAAAARFPGCQLPVMDPFATFMKTTAATTIPPIQHSEVPINLNVEVHETGPAVAKCTHTRSGRHVRPRTRYTDANCAEPYEPSLSLNN